VEGEHIIKRYLVPAHVTIRARTPTKSGKATIPDQTEIGGADEGERQFIKVYY
jgi:hypothetical protein